ncbi:MULTISPECIES: GNAT family N-acetyltransferase [unclassified Colwellia]|jgi:ElaA protein|uniref:GNAT family N-acetyltransferase n=1 Tax=unclassified Colwellia TaxID=196834 RepID=UPI0015F53A6E|nr:MULTISPECIES: GNAT family N-acetyltransferase [unclassified Colwellia]MBA6353235.1 GNAT family N-acetyltransferase [Colwellia sp. BRX9-1]MBA6357327.1 GNAT family N-acetyltransferase [Colwellia sp. BRX8-3]MBA6359547.1 GNAT family N-acetyltransferase [Colwellia sp. BRX8-6]MBA6367428.1 GNAT family N-acetyltransferase [Colwellia sp. BRX8-5]MBA6373813.1 GNAT family N-acetyltransferase [Colwellia sp. BRX8-2]
MKVAWQVKHFKALNIDELYEILKLRIDVFVVEQTCFYADIDDVDRHEDTVHLFCYLEGKIAGYLRILAKGQSYRDYIAIGRVIVASHARGTGLGHQLMAEALTVCQQYFPDQQIKISAQEHLESFYGNHGFERVSAMYLEDDIPHIAMLKVDQ